MKLPVKYDDLNQARRRLIREEYVRIQKGKCLHCGSPLDRPPHSSVRSLPITESLFPEGFLKWPVHLHHSHDTGMTIGVVHSYCNAVLWEYYNE